MFICLLLAIGSIETRFKKVDFLSKTIYLPFISTVTKLESILKANSENDKLKEDLANLFIKQNILETKIRKFYSTNIDYIDETAHFIRADVTGFSGTFQKRYLIINKGKNEGIIKNMAVICQQGIVGKIISVGQNFSVILPVNHPLSKVGVLDKRSRVQGVLETDINGNMLMSIITKESDIAKSDTIVTSNISTLFPAGFPVGQVLKICNTPEDIYVQAEIKSFVDINNLENVIILLENEEKNNEQENRKDY